MTDRHQTTSEHEALLQTKLLRDQGALVGTATERAGDAARSKSNMQHRGQAALLKLFRNTILFSSHHLKGVYTCTICGGKPGIRQEIATKILCTLREGEMAEDDSQETGGPGAAYGPIALTHQGCCATLRPWDPTACVIAAGICNHFIHLPIWPGCILFVVDCSLRTMSHIADIIGSKGRMVGVIDVNSPSQPTQAELHRFFMRYPNTFVAIADVHAATLEDYERMLSLPESSKQSFLMAMHPRCGADSAVRRLLEADEPQHIFRRIFKFLECGDVANVKCLVFCHWPPGTTMDTTRDVMLRHIEFFSVGGFLRTWRSRRPLLLLVRMQQLPKPTRRSSKKGQRKLRKLMAAQRLPRLRLVARSPAVARTQPQQQTPTHRTTSLGLPTTLLPFHNGSC